MDLTLEIDTENQQHIKLKLIHDTTKNSTAKSTRSCCMFASSKPKSNRSGHQVFHYYGVKKNVQFDLVCKNQQKSKKKWDCANANIKTNRQESENIISNINGLNPH